eukprot:scaffold285_cov111-Isochrysis_galbana.AAC.2
MPAAGGTRSAKGRRAGRRPGSQRGERGLLGLLLGGGGVFAGWKRVHVGQRACSRGGCARLRRFSGGCGQDRVRATSRNAAAVAGVRVRGWRIRGVVAVELLAARLVIPQEPKIKTR